MSLLEPKIIDGLDIKLASITQCSTTDGPLMGDCIYDSMTITTPGSPAPPVICGYNTGQHMWVEASEACNRIVFSLGLGRQTTSPRYSYLLFPFL